MAAPGTRPTSAAGPGAPRNGDTYSRLAAGFAIGTSTAWRYVREAIDLLAASADDVTAAVRAAPPPWCKPSPCRITSRPATMRHEHACIALSLRRTGPESSLHKCRQSHAALEIRTALSLDVCNRYRLTPEAG